ncbi:MAG: hypothetical protein AB1746_14735 [Candidatus Zixiibacteriota bacterium]
MRMIFILITFIMLLISSTVFGSVSFSLEQTIEIPDSLGTSGYSLADPDGDGNDEVIVDGDEFTAVFSITKNQVTDFF